MKYTGNQQKAIDHWEGNLQIIACVGSRKTDVITRRIAKLDQLVFLKKALSLLRLLRIILQSFVTINEQPLSSKQ